MNSRSTKKANVNGSKKRKKWIVISTLILSVLLASGYLFGVFFYSTNVLKTVVYNDQKTGIVKYSDIDSYMKEVVEGQTVVIKTADPNENITVPMKSIEPKYSIDEATNDLKSQTNVWRWPVQLFTRSVLGLHVNMTIDGDLLKQRLTDVGLFDNSKRLAANDAQISVGDNGVEITPAKVGTQLNEEATFQKIQEALNRGELTIDVSDCTIPPLTSEKDLEQLKQEADSYIQAPIALTLGKDKLVLTPKQKSGLLSIDDKAKKVTISSDGVTKLMTELNNQFVKAQGGESATTKVEFGNGAAKIVANAANILSMNVQKEAATVKQALESKQGIDYAPAVQPNASGMYTYVNAAGNITKNGSHFIEVSIPAQKLWMYQGDKVVLAADIVTGSENATKNTPTIRGLFQILYKQQGTTLRGSTVGYTGDQDYNVKVNYWIPFESNGYGLHDAEGWKPYARYGGTYYKSEGSHGCVNMRNADVKVVYDTAPTGTPLWVHE